MNFNLLPRGQTRHIRDVRRAPTSLNQLMQATDSVHDWRLGRGRGAHHHHLPPHTLDETKPTLYQLTSHPINYRTQ